VRRSQTEFGNEDPGGRLISRLDGGPLSAQYRRRVTSLASLNRALRIVLWCALVAGIAIMSLGVRQVDLWWQLPEGLSIIHTHHLPTQPPAAFGLPAQPYIDEYGLYEIGLGALYLLGGLAAIHVAFIATYLLIFLAPLVSARGMRRDIISLALLALAGIFLVNRFEQRPEIAGVLLFSLLVHLMRRTPSFSLRFLLRIALLMVIWTNVHSSYLIGLLALFLWLGDRVFLCEPRLRWSLSHAGLTLAVVGGAVLINPYGWHRVAFTFEQEHDMGSNLLSREMWPAWDQPPLAQALMAAAGVLILAAVATRQRPPLWLVMLAGAAYLLALFNFRHISFLAMTLLFLYAERREENPSPRWQPARTLVLGAGCIALLLFDFIALRSAIGNLRISHLQQQSAFAPALLQAAKHDDPAAVLCHDAEGSYLTFAGGLFPLIDSGQGRFDDDTKRFYFFTVQDPHAFNLALNKLPALDEILVTPPVEGWALALMRRLDWDLVAVDPNGLLFRRNDNTVTAWQHLLPSANRTQIPRLAQLRDQALREGNPVWAFCFSALIDKPVDSLNLLDRSPTTAWSEAFFSFARAWIRTVPEADVTAFLSANPKPRNLLLHELVVSRLHLPPPLPSRDSSGLERLARVLTFLDANEPNPAHAVLTFTPRPIVSPLYYALRSTLFPDGAHQESPTERWQDWNADGEELFQRVIPQLQKRTGDITRP
jgi:hypothetical protein